MLQADPVDQASVRVGCRAVGGVVAKDLALRSNATERAQAGAWALRHEAEVPVGLLYPDRQRAWWEATDAFETVSFPEDMPAEHPLWK